MTTGRDSKTEYCSSDARIPTSDDADITITRLEHVAIVYPSGNPTVIVFDDVSAADKKMLNQQIIDAVGERFPDFPIIEQCCVVVAPEDKNNVARIEMFGGEFCGNAARSVIKVLTDEASLPQTASLSGSIEFSGIAKSLDFSVQGEIISIEMPIPECGSGVERVEEGSIIRLDGISHLVVTDRLAVAGIQSDYLIRLINENQYGFAELPAVGLTCFDKAAGRAEFSVWVRDVDTVFDETACGSGTAAIGIATAIVAQKDSTLTVIQPSGESITTTAILDSDGLVRKSNIQGTVSVLYAGYLELQ